MVQNVLPAGSKLVALVNVTTFLYKTASYLEYDNPRVVGVTPCLEENGAYYDLYTGKKVSRTNSMQVWGISVGTMFRYPDSSTILVSRKFDGELLLLRNFPFNPKTMVLYNAK